MPGASPAEAFCAGNIIKYITRYRLKNKLEDLNKASVYLERLKKELAITEEGVVQ